MYNEKTWKDGEKLAQDYMKKNGYKILDINYSCVGVELDIVAVYSRARQIKDLKVELKERLKYAEEKESKEILKTAFRKMKLKIVPLLIFTEVKARTTDKFGVGAEAVDEFKQRNIIIGAKFYQKNFNLETYQVRFDVASVDDGVVSYIKDAFYDNKN